MKQQPYLIHFFKLCHLKVDMLWLLIYFCVNK